MDEEAEERANQPWVSVWTVFSSLGDTRDGDTSWSEAVMAKRMGTGILAMDLNSMDWMPTAGRGFFQGNRFTPIPAFLRGCHQAKGLVGVSSAPQKFSSSTPTLKGITATWPSS